ncbi:uncharacterized protein LOC129755852 [Uranotaenia lowii]|uniref:uncharacterized protein LOC129754673 n=1 Tax=Uranotaenia lowii TaxID=190385 RepID=UPI00247A533F|nr:uncharacterized protein LOC129754673 [Uranotaenia lowii]XP_055608519.1 uncharacterized protein LOC129755852 [Uranotaenia lowii]
MGLMGIGIIELLFRQLPMHLAQAKDSLHFESWELTIKFIDSLQLPAGNKRQTFNPSSSNIQPKSIRCLGQQHVYRAMVLRWNKDFRSDLIDQSKPAYRSGI